MSASTKDQVIAMLAAASLSPFYKNSPSGATGRINTMFRVAGMPSSAAAAPSTTGAALDRTTAGALILPAPSNTTYLVGAYIGNNGTNVFSLYDRLVETGGLNGTLATAQTVSSASLPARNTTGEGAELWLEVYTSIGSTGRTATASYTNSLGVSGRTATLVGTTLTSPIAGTTQPFQLQSGDTGVQSVQSVTLSASTGTAGSFGVTIRKPILTFPPDGQAGVVAGYLTCGLAVIPDNACLEWLVLATTTGTAGQIIGNLRFGQA